MENVTDLLSLEPMVGNNGGSVGRMELSMWGGGAQVSPSRTLWKPIHVQGNEWGKQGVSQIIT